MNGIICFCRSVPAERIIGVINSGSETLEKVIDHSGAGLDCQSCHHDIERLLDSMKRKKSENLTSQLDLFL